jgi:hypothetical protein
MSFLWKYVPNDECSKPWFEQDVTLFEATRHAHPDEPPLHAAFRELEKASDGLYSSNELARQWKRTKKAAAVSELAALLTTALTAEITAFGERSAFRLHADHWCLARRESEALEATLISAAYRRLGLRLLEPIGRWWVPADAEHRFLEAKPSTIPGAGLGVFLRQGRLLRSGTVIAEYRGSTHSRPRRGHEAYTVKLKDGRYISGINDDGSVNHLAALVNDHGRDANCQLHEFEELPGRVFMVAVQDIEPGDEVYVKYGAAYWGAKSYKVLEGGPEDRSTATVTIRASADEDHLSTKAYCRTCRNLVERHIFQLHKKTCDDALSSSVLPFEELNCLPLNPFTQCGDPRSRTDCRRAVYFVSSDRFTHLFSHETIDSESESDSDRPTDGIAARTRRRTRVVPSDA